MCCDNLEFYAKNLKDFYDYFIVVQLMSTKIYFVIILHVPVSISYSYGLITGSSLTAN